MPPKQVDRFLEIYTAELLKFDANFEKEQPVIARIKEILDILNAQKKKNDDQAVIDFCNEKIRKPLNDGKFDKVLQKYGGYNARTVADGIIKELGRSRKDCPLSDVALAKEIIAILAEKFPGKYTV
jgi:spore coat polysaccharide biosynthesis protein SpsF (cytidylyltransferase family)